MQLGYSIQGLINKLKIQILALSKNDCLETQMCAVYKLYLHVLHRMVLAFSLNISEN